MEISSWKKPMPQSHQAEREKAGSIRLLLPERRPPTDKLGELRRKAVSFALSAREIVLSALFSLGWVVALVAGTLFSFLLLKVIVKLFIWLNGMV